MMHVCKQVQSCNLHAAFSIGGHIPIIYVYKFHYPGPCPRAQPANHCMPTCTSCPIVEYDRIRSKKLLLPPQHWDTLRTVPCIHSLGHESEGLGLDGRDPIDAVELGEEVGLGREARRLPRAKVVGGERRDHLRVGGGEAV